MNIPKEGSTLNRRAFFKSTAIGPVALAIPGFTLLDGVVPVFAGTKPTINSSDVAVLKFLAAAELLEADLWGQYSELATNNPQFRRALQEIDNSLPDYVTGDFDDETSHAAFINAFLSLRVRIPSISILSAPYLAYRSKAPETSGASPTSQI